MQQIDINKVYRSIQTMKMFNCILFNSLLIFNYKSKIYFKKHDFRERKKEQYSKKGPT